jgi:hypothetical protein
MKLHAALFSSTPSKPETRMAQSVHSLGYVVSNPAVIYWQKQEMSPIRNVQTGSRAHPASYSMGTAVPSRWKSGRSVNSTTHLLCPHLLPWRGQARLSSTTSLPPSPPPTKLVPERNNALDLYQRGAWFN